MSHQSHMTPKTAMVLAAGLGTRMRPLTDTRPKPLIEVAGKALIDWTLDRFAAAGVERAVVNVHYRADQMEAHLKSRLAPSIIISDERALLLETGGGLKKARSALGPAPIFCTNTDAILVGGSREPCRLLSEEWRDEDMDALLLLTPIANASGYDGRGDFDIANARPEWRKGESAPFVFTGLQILRPKLLDGAPDGPFSTRLLWEKAMTAGRIFAAIHDGPWMHVGDPQGLALAESFFDKMSDVEKRKAGSTL
ncbi:MAG: nucleotidyltransferase family protein [Parvularculaceae bacterium]|nr:nucleotidyltransferase family protein [Parvularculaceae bacterium]